ncbi:MAG: ATP synthase subunit I [Pyrinomonadaceae bacterium]
MTNEVAVISHRGILIIMAALIAAGTIVGFAFGGPRFGIGVVFGGILSFVNYFWLERSTRAMFEPAAIATSGILAAKYIFRYVAIGAVLLVTHWSDALPITAVILGLAAFAFAVVIHGLKNIFSGAVS